MTELSCSEFAKIVCENDERIHGKLRGLSVERTGTLGKSAGCCDICLRKRIFKNGLGLGLGLGLRLPLPVSSAHRGVVRGADGSSKRASYIDGNMPAPVN